MALYVGQLERASLDEAGALLGRACPFDEATEVAEEKLFGPSPPPTKAVPLGAWEDGRLAGLAVLAGRWVRLLAVEPALRGRGVGARLLKELCERQCAAGHKRMRLADQAGNYLAPGIDVRDSRTISWFEHRGFRRIGHTENLTVILRGNPLVTPARAAALAAAVAAQGYQVRRATHDDAASLGIWMRRYFNPVWAFEVERALENEPPAVHIALRDGDPVAFAAHDGNNRGLGWFGPAGTLEEHRGRGLGQALLVACLLDVAARGRREGTIAWAGPRGFYERAVGAVSGRRFVLLERLP